MKHHVLAFVDLETTGLHPLKHEIIEIGVVRATQGKDQNGRPTLSYLDEREIALKPLRIEDADPKSLEINQYHKRDWTHAVAQHEGLSALALYLDGCVFVAQNVTADWSFLLASGERHGVPFEHVVHYHKLDLASMVFGKFYATPDLYKFSLREMSVHFQVANTRAHTALSDARTTFEICKRVIEGDAP